MPKHHPVFVQKDIETRPILVYVNWVLHWLCFYKWWWSVYIWGLGVLVVNACLVYRDVMEQEGVPTKDWLTHYQFQLQVALAWIDLDEEDLRARRRRLARKRETAPASASTERTAKRTIFPNPTVI